MGPGGAGFDAAGVLLRWASLRGRQVRPSVGGRQGVGTAVDALLRVCDRGVRGLPGGHRLSVLVRFQRGRHGVLGARDQQRLVRVLRHRGRVRPAPSRSRALVRRAPPEHRAAGAVLRPGVLLLPGAFGFSGTVFVRPVADAPTLVTIVVQAGRINQGIRSEAAVNLNLPRFR